MGKRGWTILSFFLLILVGTTCYFLFAGEKEDPNLAPLKEELKKIQSQNLTPQQMMAVHMQIREKAKDLSDSARHELRQVGMEGMRNMMNQRMDAYFNAPEAQKKMILDQQIREMEAMRKQFEAMRAQGDGPGGRGGEGGQANGGRGGQGGGGEAGGGPDGGRHGGGPAATQEERDQRHKNRMENSDPRERSRRMEYMSAVQERRKELGLPEMRGPGRH